MRLRLQAKLPSQLSAFGPGQIQRASLPPKKRALRTSTCVAMRFHLRRGGFPLIVIRGFPLFLILLLYFCHRVSLLLPLLVHTSIRVSLSPLQRATRAARPSAQLKKGSAESVLSEVRFCLYCVHFCETAHLVLEKIRPTDIVTVATEPDHTRKV